MEVLGRARFIYIWNVVDNSNNVAVELFFFSRPSIHVDGNCDFDFAIYSRAESAKSAFNNVDTMSWCGQNDVGNLMIFEKKIYKRDPKGSRSRRAVSLTRQEKQHKTTFGGESTWWWVIFDWLENVSYSQRAYSRISHYVYVRITAPLSAL